MSEETIDRMLAEAKPYVEAGHLVLGPPVRVTQTVADFLLGLANTSKCGEPVTLFVLLSDSLLTRVTVGQCRRLECEGRDKVHASTHTIVSAELVAHAASLLGDPEEIDQDSERARECRAVSLQLREAMAETVATGIEDCGDP